MAWEKSIRKRGGGGRGEFTPHCELFHFFQITLFFFFFFQRHLFFDLTIQCGLFNNYQPLSISSVPAKCWLYKYNTQCLRGVYPYNCQREVTYAFYNKRKCEYLGVKLNEARYENQLLENTRKCNPTPIPHQYILSQRIIQISQGIQFQSITLKNQNT